MSYSKQELIESLIEFKNEYGRYPTRKDFRAKKITPSKNVYYRAFRSMEKAIKQVELYGRGEFVFEEEQKTRHYSVKRGKFICPFCGSDKQKPFDYTTCEYIIRSRLIELLRKSENQYYSNAIFDCLVSIFGRGHTEVEQALKKAGFYAQYMERVVDWQ